MTDRQFQIIMERLSSIEVMQQIHKDLINELSAKVDKGLAADVDNRRLIEITENLQKDLSSLKDEITM